MRRTLAGLALFVCLMAAGWAWLDEVPQDVTGMYVRIVNEVDRDQVCAASTGVEPGGMRVTDDIVQFANRTCEIMQRDERSEETTEGPSIMVELGLVCGDDPAGPDGQSATVFLHQGRADLTTYIADGGGYTPAHATFLGCATNRDQ